MKVLALRADEGGCALYRIKEPARVVAEQFSEVSVRVDTNVQVKAEKSPDSGHTIVTEVEEDVDLIIVQRPLNQAIGSMLEQARRQRIATIVELDDDLSNVHPRNAAYPHIQPLTKPLDNYLWLEKTAAAADLLTVSTEALRKYNQSSSVVLPNYVPERIFDVKFRLERSVPVVGWTGTLQTHPDDLESTRGQVGRIVADADLPFFVVGDKRGVREVLKLRPQTQLRDSGWVPLADYYQTIADSIDIGIVPLDRNEFNRCKSRLKGLEMAALGIPFVASATEDYEALETLGVGETAFDHSDFRNKLRRLVNDPERRFELGKQYRSVVRSQLTYELHAQDWLDAWQQAIDIRKKATS